MRFLISDCNCIDAYFVNNKLVPYQSAKISDNNILYDPGLGTLSFFGNSLIMQTIVFANNYNSKAAGIYIDGHSDVLNLDLSLIDIYFANNLAEINGGALYIGSGILNLKSLFQNITCFNNSAYSHIFFLF